MRFLFLLPIALTVAASAQTYDIWKLDSCKLSYHMSHPIHEVDGVSRAAKGKGVCDATGCDFLLAAPVKSFDSGDSNRDLHMLQVTRGAQFPVVMVRFHLANPEPSAQEVSVDLEVEFAGNHAHYAHVPFHQDVYPMRRHVTGTIPATLTDFHIDPPTFLTVPIKNSIPISVDCTWLK